MTPSVIRLKNVGKKYRLFASPSERLKELLHPFGRRYHREFWALRGITIDVRPGETLGILGRNGSGKSTLLQIIAAVLPTTEGTVDVVGRVSALLELGAGFNPELTGRQNVALYSTLTGMSRREADQRLPEVLRFADIGEYIDQPMKTYSTGLFMRLAFAAAVSIDPDILLIDEALAVGDGQFQQKCFSRLHEFQRLGKTIVLVTHDPQVVTRHCSRAIVLDRGTVVCDTEPADALGRYYELLYGPASARVSEVPSGGPSPVYAQSPDAFVASLFNLGSQADDLLTRPNYNPNEFRMGTQEARILDAVTVVGDRPNTARVISGERVDLYVRTLFLVQVSEPVYGLHINTKDGVMLYGTTTLMQRRETTNANPGEEVVVRLSFAMPFRGGDVFLDIGLGHMRDGQFVVFDARVGVLQLEVESTPSFDGLADVRAEYQEMHRGRTRPLHEGDERNPPGPARGDAEI